MCVCIHVTNGALARTGVVSSIEGSGFEDVYRYAAKATTMHNVQMKQTLKTCLFKL